MSEPIAFTPRPVLTNSERRTLDCCLSSVGFLIARARYKKAGNPEGAFSELQQACQQIAAARANIEQDTGPLETMFAFSRALARITPRHAATLAMTLMAWDLRMWPGQDDQVTRGQGDKATPSSRHLVTPSSCHPVT